MIYILIVKGWKSFACIFVGLQLDYDGYYYKQEIKFDSLTSYFHLQHKNV